MLFLPSKALATSRGSAKASFGFAFSALGKSLFLKAVYVDLLAVFFLAQCVGLLAGALFIFKDVSAVENPSDPANALQLFAGILFSTIVILLVMRFFKGGAFFKILESFLVFTSFSVLASLVGLGDMASFTAGLAAVAARLVLPAFKLPSILVASVVIGALLGASLDFLPVFIFAVVLSAYDFLAVFFTKHMVALAKGLEERKASFMVSLHRGKEKVRLGTGDVVVPLVVTVSVFKSFGLPAAVFSLLGSALGMAFLLAVLSKKKGYLPGLPPLVGGQLASVAVFLLANSLLPVFH